MFKVLEILKRGEVFFHILKIIKPLFIFFRKLILIVVLSLPGGKNGTVKFFIHTALGIAEEYAY